MAKEKEDIFVPLMPSWLTVDNFSAYREQTKIRLESEKKVDEEKVKLLLDEQSFGITFNTIIIPKKDKNLVLPDNFKPIILEKHKDKLDGLFFEESESLFERSIYYRNQELRINFHRYPAECVKFYLFINIARFKEKKELCIYTFTLTTFNPMDKNKEPEYIQLSNIEVINLSKKCVEIFTNKEFLKKYELDKEGTPTIVAEDSDSLSVGDTFRSIQFWGKLNINDARDVINKDIGIGKLDKLYYFYSILTQNYAGGLLRKHFENIADVMGYCQSVSEAYFDIFYGNICLEVTIKPKYEIFQQIGHDSEEFRIWEILALQSHIVKDKELKSDKFRVLEKFFDFQDFTRKLEKGGYWIDYANYLKKVTGIQYRYNIKKRELELEEKEREKALQKLNILIIVSIFISIITFLLSPIYNESVVVANSTNLSNVMNNLSYKNYILNNSNPEGNLILYTGFVFTIVAIFWFKTRIILKHIKNRMFDLIRYFQKKEHLFDLILVLLLAIGAIFLLWIKLKSIP